MKTLFVNACVVGLFVAASLRATEVVPLSLNETVRQADAIVVGTVTRTETRWGNASHRWMLTDYVLAVEDVVYSADHSPAVANSIVLTYWGGTIDGQTQTISDLRRPAVGERQLVMLSPGW